MTQVQSIQQMAKNMLTSQSTEQLIDAFDATETANDAATFEVRGWLMEELESRNPVAFETWLESNEASPKRFY